VSVAFGADGNPAGTSYLVELSLNGVSFTTSLSTQSLNATAVGLSGNTTYYAEVVAVNGAGVPSAPSNVVKFVTPSGVPAAPAGGGPGTVYTSSATANWALSGGATDYVLVASTSPANPPTAIAASSTTAASTGTLTGLGPNTTYYFFVSACDYGCSPYTAIGSTITAAAPALTVTSTAVSSAAVSVAFNADGNPAGTKYLVEVSTDGVDFTTALSTLSVNATASGLSPNTTYYFEVVAVNGAGIPTVPSNILQIVTPLGVPAAPTGGGPSVVYTSSATANWAMSQGATDYVLVASTNSTVPPYPITASSTTVMSTATLTGLGPNTTYYFFVSACGSGCSPYAVVGSTLTDAAPAITLSTTAVSSNTVSVAFGADGNPSGTKYLVELSTDGVDFTASLSTQALNATAVGLGGDTTYYAEVVAVNGAGVLSVPSNVVKFTTLPGTPTAPTGGAPVAVSSSSATVGWNLSANATDYVLVASTNSALPPYPITASSTTLGNVGTVTGLGPNTTYYFFVAACGTGCSNFALAGSTLTAAAPALTLTSTAVSSSTVSLAWNADGNPAGTKYLVELSTDGVDFTTALSTLSVNATATGLNANATYYFEVVAVNGAGVKAAPSNVLQVLTALGAPAAPTGGAPGTVYTSSATVNWGLSAGATDYVLVASQSPNNPPTSIVATTTTLTSPGTLTGLGPNTTYYFFVTACAGGCSSYDAAGSTITAAAPAIALTTTSVSTSTVSLAWNADGNPAGTKYVVEESTDGVDFAAALSTASVDATASGLNGNTTYYFEIVAVNGAGTPTSPSNVVQILTPPGPPAPPTGGAVIATSSVTATAAWTVSTGATDYVLIASTGAANPTAAIAGSSTTLSNAATIAGLSPNTTYYLFTSACGVGCSSFASDGSTITLATPAVGLSTSSVFANFVSLTWGSGGNPAGTTYQILESLNGVNYTLAATATGTSGSVSGLTHNTTYFFEVVAVNFAGTPTAPSAPVQVVTPLVATLPEVPMEPLGVTVSAGPNSVRLGWSPTTRYTGGVPFASTGTPVAGELEGYAIYRSTEICGPNFVQVSTVGLSAAPTYTDATGGVSYYYRLFSYNTVGLSTGVVTVSPLGERYFFTDDCVTNLAVDPQTAVAINGLVGTSNGLGGDVRIVRTRRPQDNGSNILESAQWYAYLNGVTLLSSYALPTPGHYTLHVTTQAGNAVPDLNPINTASPFGGIVVTPISGAASVTPIDDLGAVWYNGQQFVNLYGKIDTVDDNVDFDSPNLGLFQIRAQARSSSGPVFDATNISSKIITPDSPGHTAVWIFSYDPGPNNVIPSGRVYDLHGEHIADLQPGLVPNTLTWDGRMNGRTVSSGVYIYHISGGGKTFSGTIVVAK
jgi:phosphodiesterase/alkaline phosphatase D-like protein